MKRLFSALCLCLFLASALFPANAMVYYSGGIPYGMGEHASVYYQGQYYERQSMLGDDQLVLKLCADNGWTPASNLTYLTQFRFINGKIYNKDYPNGLPQYDWLLNRQEYVFEMGRAAAFRRAFPTSEVPPYAVFTDVYPAEHEIDEASSLYGNPNHSWYDDGLRVCVREGYFTGYFDRMETNGMMPGEEGYQEYKYYSFRPERTMTRAEVLSTLMRTSYPKVRDYGHFYYDVPETAWYYDCVERAFEAGFIDDSVDAFNPDGPATREFAAQLLSHVMKGSSSDVPLPFTDAADLAPACRDGVQKLLNGEILHGYPDNSFRPKATITRAEYAQMLGTIIDRDLLTGDTVNEIYAKEYSRRYFEASPDEQEFFHDADISYPFYG